MEKTADDVRFRIRTRNATTKEKQREPSKAKKRNTTPKDKQRASIIASLSVTALTGEKKYIKYEIATGLFIPVDPDKDNRFWHKRKERANKHYPAWEELNNQLDRIAFCMIKTYDFFKSKGFPSQTEFKKKYEDMSSKKPAGRLGKEQKHSFASLKDDFFKDGTEGLIVPEGRSRDAATPWSFENLRKYQNAFMHWADFDKEQKITLSNFEAKTLLDFKNYLVSIDTKNTTTEKITKCIRVYSKWLARNGHIKTEVTDELKKQPLGLKQLSLKDLIEVNNVALTESEVLKIYNHQLDDKNKHLEWILDCFVFQCYTGMRYSNLVSLKKTNVKTDQTGNTPFGYLDFYAKKNDRRCIVPLSKTARLILDKYQDIGPEGKALQVPVGQYYVRSIKKIAELCGISELTEHRYYIGNQLHSKEKPKHELLGSHTARKTFINICRAKKIDPEVIAKMVGDSLQTIMRHYTSVRNEDIFMLGDIFK